MSEAGAARSAGLLEVERSVVVVIDVQGKLVEQVHRPELLRAGISRLLQVAELFGVPVVLTEQYPRGLGPTEAPLRHAYDALTGGKRKVEKTSFGCCSEPGFDRAVGELLPGVPANRRQYVVAGIEAHVCVLQTVLPLLQTGAEVHVCWECVSGRGEETRATALQRMAQAGAVMTHHESVGFEWARDKNHPRFKEFSQLLRGGQVG